MARGAVKETGVNAITGSFSRILAIGSGSGGGNQSLINLSASLAPGTDNLYILGTANKIFKSITSI